MKHLHEHTDEPSRSTGNLSGCVLFKNQTQCHNVINMENSGKEYPLLCDPLQVCPVMK
jgi:hypothetical protein